MRPNFPRDFIKNFVIASLLAIVPSPFLAAENPGGQGITIWPSDAPAGIPFDRSKELIGIGFTGRRASYELSDTWYPSWAENGNMYSSFTDGTANKVYSRSVCIKGGGIESTGFAAIVGDDPQNLKIADAGIYKSPTGAYDGRYPSGNLVYNGVWFYGTYCLFTSMEPGKSELGPFVGFRYSTDYGKTWHQTKHTPSTPLFHEPTKFHGNVKLANPHFVDFGRNMQYSPDGKAYFVSHGCDDSNLTPRDAQCSWITGDQIYMARVSPSAEDIDDESKYEYFAGIDSRGTPTWTHDFAKIKPLLSWLNNMGCVTVTYDAPLKKYLMSVTDGGTGFSRYNTYILESNQLVGPWKLVTYMRSFGEQAYFVNIPSKFISKDGRTAWLSYSANFTNGNQSVFHVPDYAANPPGGSYAWTLQEVRLLGP